MTKTLTEQYKNKELSGWYYVKTKDGSINHWLLFTDTIEFEKDIEEVLAPVPSYDEYKRLVSNSDESFGNTEQLENELPTEQVLNLQKMVEDECSRRCELETKCRQLEKELSRKTLQLEIATKALKEINKNYRFTVAQDVVYKALKEMEGVK